MDLEKALHRLPKKSPSAGFVRASKNRLLSRIEEQKSESWFKAFLKNFTPASPSRDFVVSARVRLIEKIHQAHRPVWMWLTLVKRLAASTLIMTLAVTTTLFFVEGKTTVNASEKTTIQILHGRITLKHADMLTWDEIIGRVELSAGDLIKVDEGAEAVIHFFDDTELRLSGNTSLLLSRIEVSPVYARQGVIEVSLHEGNAWAQTLNADDGYAGLTLITRDAVISALNASFDVHTTLQEPTTVRVFSGKTDITSMEADTRNPVDRLKGGRGEEITILSSFNSKQKPVITRESITNQEETTEWIQSNLEKDAQHLTMIRQNALSELYLSAGTLPGDMLYPVKQAKERLKLAFTFNESELNDTRIEIANSRLNEAIVLLERGEQEKAADALTAYQEISRVIAEEVKQNKVTETTKKRLITPHQKTLVASLPGPSSVDIVKQTLNETKELLAEDSTELAKIRVENTLENLRGISTLAEMGDYNAVKEALKNHEIIATGLLDEVATLPDEEKEEALRSLLDVRSEELTLIQSISEGLKGESAQDEQLEILLADASKKAEEQVERVKIVALPFLPEISASEPITPRELTAQEKKVREFVDKVAIYKTWQGQKNQINRLLKDQPAQARDIEFLLAIRDNLEGRTQDLINIKILELESAVRVNKDKIMKRKLEAIRKPLP